MRISKVVVSEEGAVFCVVEGMDTCIYVERGQALIHEISSVEEKLLVLREKTGEFSATMVMQVFGKGITK